MFGPWSPFPGHYVDLVIDVVVIGGGPWGPDVNFPTHHTARILAQKHRVLYVYRDAHTSLAGQMLGRLPGFHSSHELLSHVFTRRRIDKVAPNLWVMPVSGLAAALPLSYPPLSRWLTAHIISRQINWALLRLRFTKPLLWFYWWFYPEIVDRVAHAFAVYDIYDDHMEYDFVRDNRSRKREAARQEQLLLNAVDLTFVVSNQLVITKHSPQRVVYLPNGVDTQTADRASRQPCPPDIAQLSRPIAGYLGSYDSRMDWDLVKAMARQTPDWSYVFVGGGYTAPSDRPPNLHLMGNRDYTAALSYVNCFDVALIPFVRDALTDAICPAKLFDYLALGKPIITTAIPAVLDIACKANHVYVGNTAGDFVQLAREALREDGNLSDARRALARNHTWQGRTDKAWRAIVVAMAEGS